MKPIILIVVLTLLLSANIHAQNNTASAAAEQQIITVLEQMTNAYTKSDVSLFDKCLASTYTMTDPGGAVHNKKDMIDYMKGGNYHFESITPSDRKISVYQNTALVTQHTIEKGHVGNEDITGEYRWMYVFAKEGADWKVIAVQGTHIMSPGKS